MPLPYRVRQFLHTVSGPATAPDLSRVAHLLTPEQKALFSRMSIVDQWHCLAVATALAHDGHDDHDLLRAALIHDVGKSLAHIAAWERVAHVLLKKLAPSIVGRLGATQPGGLGHGLYILAHHAHLGADLAAQAGFSPATVALVRGEGEPYRQRLLDQADDAH